VELSWIDPEHPSSADLAGAVALGEAARAVDRPHEISRTVSAFVGKIRHGWDGDAPLVAVSRDQLGRVNGVLQVWLPTWDNTHLGGVEVTVDPRVRRRGLGRRLFGLGVERVRAQRRRLVLSEGVDGSGGMDFAKAMGLNRVSTEVHRRQDVHAIDWDRLDREEAAALTKAAGYELVRMAGRTDPEMIAEVTRITAAINDAPTDDMDIEDETFTPERVWAFEAAQAARNRRLTVSSPATVPPANWPARRWSRSRGSSPAPRGRTTPASCVSTAVTGSACC
jgi:GNAT superfamily N-acetyltransferase